MGTQVQSATDGSASTVILVGTGAVENAWKPIYRALRKGVSPQLPDDADLANLEMARIVHLLRFFHKRHTEQQRLLLEAVARLKVAIASELEAAMATGEVKARSSFTATLASITAEHPARNVCVVSTNWDTSVNHAALAVSSKIRVLQLHGGINDSDTLYLPSETTTEPYRTPDELKLHAKINRAAIEVVESATHLVVYGLSLSPLDAEVCQVLWAGRQLRPPLERVTVVDTHATQVARRLALVLGSACLPVEGIIEQLPPSRKHGWVRRVLSRIGRRCTLL